MNRWASFSESAGYVVRCFPSAESILLNGLSNADVLISDIGMPGLNGFELCDLVRRTRPNFPVILITGRHEVAEQAQARGIARLFCKPFDGPALLRAIDDAVSDAVKGER